MKKIALLAAIGCSALTASAQLGKNGGAPIAEYPHRSPAAVQAPASSHADAPEGTTATPFWTETFGSGTNTTMPTGWSAAGNAQQAATWKWRKVGTSSTFSIDSILSTTGGGPNRPTNDGWMVYDSDSIGGITTPSVIEGYLTSPTINCSGHATVQLSFQQHFERYNDSCYVDVSNNNGGTWTRYSVLPNNTLATNTFLPSNPHTALVNITPTAANQAAVRIRFYYICTHPDGGYNWLVDDLAISELDPVEAAVDGGTFVMTLRDPDAGYTSFGTYPKQFVDSVFPIVKASNYGSTAQANANITARIFRAGTQVYNRSILYTLPLNAIDSQVDFRSQPGYPPTDTGVYLITFNVNQTGDVNPLNNNDSMNFRVSDSTLSMNTGFRGSNYFIQNPVSGTNPTLLHRQVGVWFEIPANKSDTVTSITTAFSDGTTVGSIVQAQIYKQVVSGSTATWLFKGETLPRTLTTADISGTSGVTLLNLPMDRSNGLADLVLDGGYYAAVVRGQGNPAANTILIPSFQSPAFGVFTYSDGSPTSFGTFDTSDNQAFSYTYGAPGAPLMYQLGNSTPVVRPNFGSFGTTSVKDINVATLGAAYPNPANTKVSIPVSLKAVSEVSVSLATATGQVVARQSLGKQAAGRGFEISFPTGNLANGVYFYTVEAGGEKQTGRVAVAH